MGVPAFYKWLTLRYPNIVINAKEPVTTGLDIDKIIKDNYIDTSMPEIDNLYLDMNGIIHPCSHPMDRDSPSSIQEMYNSVFDYVDKVVRIIRPKQLIYMAIDGVAPRAKMNQQRSRRFRAALEAMEKQKEKLILEREWKSKGLIEIKNDTPLDFDSNVITPGTKFLQDLSKCLLIYVKSKINNDPLWRDLTVIFSDANVPGEGEHKILDFIRTQRVSNKYNPNTSHCIYGADADLIMLALIIHEPHFYIIRESLNERSYIVCEKCGKNGHRAEECNKREDNLTAEEIVLSNRDEINKIEFSLIKIPIIRKYLELEFCHMKLNFKFDFERIIDDFVFICFLVGNDFLPHLPSLKIREGAIDALIFLYKKLLPTLNGYLTNGRGQLHLSRCEVLFKKLALVEDEFFKQENINRANDELYAKRNKKQRKSILEDFNNLGKEPEKRNGEEIDLVEIASNIMEKEEKNEFSFDELKKNGKKKFENILKEKLHNKSNEIVKEYKDTIKLGEEGWKDRYYQEKFKMSPLSHDLPKLKEIIKKFYIEGISWVFEYYYNGCVSWGWYYPFHYAPFASDLTDLSSIKIHFDKGHPFQPFEQLLSVLPPYSSKALPKCLQSLMHDPLSELADFYPSHIQLDVNNQPYLWMGVNLIPFVEEKRIRKVVKDKLLSGGFTEEEIQMNKEGNNLMISANRKSLELVDGTFTVSLDDTNNQRVYGNAYMEGIAIPNINNDKTKCYIFRKSGNIKRHSSRILDGVTYEEKHIFLHLDYPKTKFKGKAAIDIVKNVLGYKDDADEVEKTIRSEYFDDYSNNNNRAIEYNPRDIELLRKKRYQDELKAMENPIANRDMMKTMIGSTKFNEHLRIPKNNQANTNSGMRYSSNIDIKEKKEPEKKNSSEEMKKRLNLALNSK